jgi:multidrug efflux pump subunit AcrA (membrane-fusion protein)
LGTIFLQTCGSAESNTGIPAADAAIPVKVSPVKAKEHSQPLNIFGRFTTDDETTLAFKTGGILGRVMVKEGDFVRKGQLLATLDLTEINA